MKKIILSFQIALMLTFQSCKTKEAIEEPAPFKANLGYVELYDEFGQRLPVQGGVKIEIDTTIPKILAITGEGGSYDLNIFKEYVNVRYSKEGFRPLHGTVKLQDGHLYAYPRHSLNIYGPYDTVHLVALSTIPRAECNLKLESPTYAWENNPSVTVYGKIFGISKFKQGLKISLSTDSTNLTNPVNCHCHKAIVTIDPFTSDFKTTFASNVLYYYFGEGKKLYAQVNGISRYTQDQYQDTFPYIEPKHFYLFPGSTQQRSDISVIEYP